MLIYVFFFRDNAVFGVFVALIVVDASKLRSPVSAVRHTTKVTKKRHKEMPHSICIYHLGEGPGQIFLPYPPPNC